MSGGRGPKAKGCGYERQLVDYFKANGIEAQRAWGSNGRALGCAETVDVVANGCRIQAKRVKAVAAKFRVPEGADVVAFREDRGETYVMVKLDDFADMIKEGW